MSYYPGSLLAVVRVLLEFGKSEVPAEPYFRSAASRAYYGTYGVIKSRFEIGSPAIFGTSGHHQSVVDAFAELADPQIASIGYRLNRLKRSRVTSDYKYGIVCAQTSAEIALHDIEWCLDRLDKLSDGQWQSAKSEFMADVKRRQGRP